MAITLNDNLKINAGKPVDSRYLNGTIDYVSQAEVNSLISISERYLGLTVRISEEEYWYGSGVSDGDLILKTSGSTGGGTITGATNGLSTYGASNDLIGLGGTLSVDTNILGNGNILEISGVTSFDLTSFGDINFSSESTIKLGSTSISTTYELPSHVIGATSQVIIRNIDGELQSVDASDISGLGATSTILNSWGATTIDGLNLYYDEFNHNKNTKNIVWSLVDTSNEEQVLADKVRHVDDNTIRVFIAVNTVSLRIVVTN